MFKHLRFSLVAGGLAIGSLASCSRANYTFQPAAPAYLGTAPAAAPAVAAKAAVLPKVSSVVAAAPVAPALQRLAPAQAVGYPAQASVAPKLLAGQRMVMRRVAKQLAKVQAQRQNVASVAHASASKAGRAGIIALVGLAILLIGGLTGVGILATIGAIAFLVGLILLIVHLVGGD